jgi:transketolase
MNIEYAANTIRGLAMDGVQEANSGHPGAPMGLADFASVLFLKHLKHNPADPEWIDRDRFVLSAGHASMLLYSLLHLSGYDLPIEELKNFRQWGSKTPGHPENFLTPGVETTTGPLGQGCGNAVGMAVAEAMLAARYNKDDFSIIDHFTYVIASDGDLMEGISHEVFALAGHLKLSKLVVFYDSNAITIEGDTSLAYSDDVAKRFEGYHWHVQEIDGHDYDAIDAALTAAREADRPSIIIGRTHIAQGSPNKHDTAGSHGSPLGDDEVKASKEALGLPPDDKFFVPDEVYALFRERAEALKASYEEWKTRFDRYAAKHTEASEELAAALKNRLPEGLEDLLPSFEPGDKLATRKASGATIQQLAGAIPSLVGGSADLGPSNNTAIKDASSISAGQFEGRNFHFGIREHAMGAILNGIALHKGFIGFGGTFLIFSDYFKPSIRLAALMHLPVIYVLTHDSIFLGEDGPTHQAVEQLAGLRAIPNLTVIRPADAAETAHAWLAALRRTDGPTALILTRQSIPVLDRTDLAGPEHVAQGAYTLWQSGEGTPDLILLGSGSEVHVALNAGRQLADDGTNVRIVSVPSWELFEAQSDDVKEALLPAACRRRLSVEAGSTLGWERYVTSDGKTFGLDHFGASAPYQVLAEKYGFTAEHIADVARKLLN